MRERRKASAWGLPRPSATASAKLANNTVNHSHAAIWPEKAAGAPGVRRSRTKRIVTSAETTSVTKMTGFLARARGSSLRTASSAAVAMIRPSNRLWGLDDIHPLARNITCWRKSSGGTHMTGSRTRDVPGARMVSSAPASAAGRSSVSKFLRVDQSVNEVKGEAERDHEPDHDFAHCVLLKGGEALPCNPPSSRSPPR